MIGVPINQAFWVTGSTHIDGGLVFRPTGVGPLKLLSLQIEMQSNIRMVIYPMSMWATPSFSWPFSYQAWEVVSDMGL